MLMRKKYIAITAGVLLVLGASYWHFPKASPAKTIEIYEVYHRLTPIYQNDIVIPIHAGRALNKKYGEPLKDLMIGDDTGDNISQKNDTYSELTALYWMWKNSTADYVGLMHYRRQFILPHPETECNGDKLCEFGLTKDNVQNLLQKYDIIVPEKQKALMSVYFHYKMHHGNEDLDDVLDYIGKHYPDMAKSVAKVMNADSSYPCNMFIMKKELADQYAEWMFEVLDAVADGIEKRHLAEDDKAFVNENDDSKYWQSYRYRHRSPGFISERLLTIWLDNYCRKNSCKIKEVPLFVDNSLVDVMRRSR
jgi:hypothetical protein